MGKRSKSTNTEDENIKIKEKKSKNKGTKLELLEKDEDTERITNSENNETLIVSKNEDKCIKKKKSDRKHNKSLTHDSTPNKKIIFDDNAEERITVSVSEGNETQIKSKTEDKCITKKKSKRKHNKSLTHDNPPNKKIIFDDNAEALEVPINKKKKQNKKGIDPKEDEPTEEDIDQFCDEINEEDNVEYENWIQLIEAKLGSNKKKT